MIVITEHVNIPKLKIWKDVKALDTFKPTLEKSRDIEGLLRYFVVLDGTTELRNFQAYTYSGGVLTLKETKEVTCLCKVKMPWHTMSEAQIAEGYSASEAEKISTAKLFPNYLEIEKGEDVPPFQYPFVGKKEVTITMQKLETVPVQTIQVRPC